MAVDTMQWFLSVCSISDRNKQDLKSQVIGFMQSYHNSVHVVVWDDDSSMNSSSEPTSIGVPRMSSNFDLSRGSKEETNQTITGVDSELIHLNWGVDSPSVEGWGNMTCPLTIISFASAQTFDWNSCNMSELLVRTGASTFRRTPCPLWVSTAVAPVPLSSCAQKQHNST